MPFLPSLPEEAHLSDLFRRFPDHVRPLMAYTDSLLRGPGELPIGARELIASFVSGLNACHFCHHSHRIYAETFGIDGALIDALIDNIDTAPVATELRPLLHYVKKLNTLPSRMVPADAEAVYAAGWSERALYEAVSIAGLFNMMNRIVEGCGINFDYTAHPEQHPAADRDPARQAHSYGHFGDRTLGEETGGD